MVCERGGASCETGYFVLSKKGRGGGGCGLTRREWFWYSCLPKRRRGGAEGVLVVLNGNFGRGLGFFREFSLSMICQGQFKVAKG